jgi:hypothetical protein
MVDIGLHFFHQFQSSRGYVPRVHDQDNSVGPCGGGGIDSYYNKMATI